jgi:hypothetical protein
MAYDLDGTSPIVKRVTKGPYRKTDPIWWKNAGGNLFEKVSIGSVKKWKWIR